MARLNISIRDDLHARLSSVRDRLNVSRVCANALEKEVAVLEARPDPSLPDVGHMIDRMRTAAERWRSRGLRDGREWATQVASREELRSAAESVLNRPVRDSGQRVFGWPSSFNYQKRMGDWCMVDAGIPADAPILESGQVDQRDRARREADEAAFAEGWGTAVAELWQLAVVSL